LVVTRDHPKAEWRLQCVHDADAAGDDALSAAAKQGSNQQLMLGLADSPAVVSRRLDA
jgi:hypothetical protein